MKIKKLNITFIILICIILISLGCATVGNDTLREESEVSVNAKIIEGKTTQSEIKTMFGSPMTTSYTDNGLEIWKYELSNLQTDAVSFIPVVGLFAAGSSGTKKELTVLFDENEVVKKYNMSESPLKVRSGLFNQ